MDDLRSPIVLDADGPQFPELSAERKSLTFYTPQVAETILEMYIEGASLLAISRIDGMPAYSTILRWVKDSNRFGEDFDRARQARALNLEERALAVADENLSDKDEVPGARLRFDVLKWGAEAADGARFGKKVTVSGDPNRPIVFKVVTGVPESSAQRPVELDSQGLVVDRAPPLPVDAELTAEAVPAQ